MTTMNRPAYRKFHEVWTVVFEIGRPKRANRQTYTDTLIVMAILHTPIGCEQISPVLECVVVADCFVSSNVTRGT